ncbi:MAG: DUF4058 family protein [Chloroflexota bacterium]|nr:DUF4058 family protein [Chloroflexota bacterium]
MKSIKNQYVGVNAHLHSVWQSAKLWGYFHNVYMSDIFKLMNTALRPMGYAAQIEDSLQLRRVGDADSLRPRADVSIRDENPRRALTTPSVTPVIELDTFDLLELIEGEIDLDHPYAAVAIYETALNDPRGNVVAWIELLSPSNKGENKDGYAYLTKRRMLLDQGIVFVEIDFLHERPPTFERIPDYTRKERGAHPYRISVMNPRPQIREGRVKLVEFDVDSPIPTLVIPLNGDDRIEFDFDRAYHKTFEEGAYGFDVELDYAALPLNFARYSPADQTRIARRMLAVAEAAASGADMESAPFPTREVTLDEALAALGIEYQSTP